MKGTLTTGRQVRELLQVFENLPVQQMQDILESGLLPMLRDANISEVNKGEFRRACGLSRWREENGVIYFSVTSDGTTGKDWISKKRGFGISSRAESIILNADFRRVQTSCVVTEVAVVRGGRGNVHLTNFMEEACAGAFTGGRKLLAPNAEVACLIAERFTGEDIRAMKLSSVVVAHKPIADHRAYPAYLTVDSCSGGEYRYLDATGWDVIVEGRTYGFAFAVSERRA